MLTVLASALSGTLLKGFIAIWMKDQEILALTSSLAVEALQKKTSGFVEARAAKRLFEQLEDEILEGIAIYLEAEFKAMRKGDKVLLVEKSLELIASQGFYHACFEETFDQNRLLERFKSDINGFATKLLISDHYAAQSICNFAIAKYLSVLDSLPNYSKDALRALLRDTDEIIDRVKSIQIEFDTLRIKTRQEMEVDEVNFRRMLSKKLGKINVFGIDSRGLSKKYNLSIAYINLTLKSGAIDADDSPQKTLGTAFSPERRLVVIKGEPGSGKTTLLSWLALNCAENTLDGQFGNISGKIPIFLRVREYAEKELPKGVKLLTEQFGPACDAFTEDWLEEKRRDGNFVIFLDGYDEVSEEKRKEVANWVDQVLNYYPNSVVTVSTRPYANSGLTELLQEFGGMDAEISVEPMSSKQVEKFIINWYSAYADETVLAEQRKRFEISKDRLLERVLNSASIRTLIRNPLICSLICFVNADRDGFVPDQRGNLYSLATETLLDRRDRERGISQPHDVHLSLSQKQKILGYISEYFSKRQSAQLEASAVVERLAEYLPSLNLSPETSSNIVEYLSERSYILRCPSQGFVDFSHKTFLEYFYARRITDLWLIEKAAENFFDDNSREVALFTFAVGPPPFVQNLLEIVILEIVEKSSTGADVKASILNLQTAIQQASEVDPSIRAKAINLLDDVLPPKSEEEAEQLAHAGEVILEPLKEFAKQEFSATWSYIVFALLNTFLEEAAYTLVHYARLGNPKIDKLLLTGRRYFETGTYRDVVISECKTILKFEINDWGDLEVMSSLPRISSVSVRHFSDTWSDAKIVRNLNVTSLDIHSASSIKDLSILEFFPNLKYLSVLGCENLDDLQHISMCTELTELRIFSFAVKTLDFMKPLKKLKNIDLAECTELLDVKAVNSLPRVKTLQLPYSHLHDQLTLSVDETMVDLDFDFLDTSGPTDEELQTISLGEGFYDD